MGKRLIDRLIIRSNDLMMVNSARGQRSSAVCFCLISATTARLIDRGRSSNVFGSGEMFIPECTLNMMMVNFRPLGRHTATNLCVVGEKTVVL